MKRLCMLFAALLTFMCMISPASAAVAPDNPVSVYALDVGTVAEVVTLQNDLEAGVVSADVATVDESPGAVPDVVQASNSPVYLDPRLSHMDPGDLRPAGTGAGVGKRMLAVAPDGRWTVSLINTS